MQIITFRQEGGTNTAVASTTSDAAKIAIEATLYYTYQIHNLPQVILFFSLSKCKDI